MSGTPGPGSTAPRPRRTRHRSAAPGPPGPLRRACDREPAHSAPATATRAKRARVAVAGAPLRSFGGPLARGHRGPDGHAVAPWLGASLRCPGRSRRPGRRDLEDWRVIPSETLRHRSPPAVYGPPFRGPVHVEGHRGAFAARLPAGLASLPKKRRDPSQRPFPGPYSAAPGGTLRLFARERRRRAGVRRSRRRLTQAFP